MTVLEDAVARTPRRTDGARWLRVHRGLLDGFARVAASPELHVKKGRHASPGDLVVLTEAFDPRVRVVLEVRPGLGHDKLDVFDPEGEEGIRTFAASHVATLPSCVGVRNEPNAAAAKRHGDL